MVTLSVVAALLVVIGLASMAWAEWRYRRDITELKDRMTCAGLILEAEHIWAGGHHRVARALIEEGLDQYPESRMLQEWLRERELLEWTRERELVT